MGPDSCTGLLEAWGLRAAESPRLTLSLCPLQFDLQRIVIYCDSRHAELETCCDIPLGPVSKLLRAEVGRERVLGLQSDGALQGL